MIIDSLINAEKYYSVHPKLKRGFEYLSKLEMVSQAAGEVHIEDGVKAIIMHSKGMSRQESTAKFECHQQHIDIQFCISGTEEFGWKPKESCVSPQAEFDAKKDVQFFYDAPDMFFTLQEKQFVIFFPEDVHAPMISEQTLKKVVVKIRI